MEEAAQEVRRILSNNTAEEALAYLHTVSRSIEENNESIKGVIGSRYKKLLEVCERVSGMDAACRDLVDLQESISAATGASAQQKRRQAEAMEGSLTHVLKALRPVELGGGVAAASNQAPRDAVSSSSSSPSASTKVLLLRANVDLSAVDGLIASGKIVEAAYRVTATRSQLTKEMSLSGHAGVSALLALAQRYQCAIISNIRKRMKADADTLAEFVISAMDRAMLDYSNNNSKGMHVDMSKSAFDASKSKAHSAMVEYCVALHVLQPTQETLRQALAYSSTSGGVPMRSIFEVASSAAWKDTRCALILIVESILRGNAVICEALGQRHHRAEGGDVVSNGNSPPPKNPSSADAMRKEVGLGPVAAIARRVLDLPISSWASEESDAAADKGGRSSNKDVSNSCIGVFLSLQAQLLCQTVSAFVTQTIENASFADSLAYALSVATSTANVSRWSVKQLLQLDTCATNGSNTDKSVEHVDGGAPIFPTESSANGSELRGDARRRAFVAGMLQAVNSSDGLHVFKPVGGHGGPITSDSILRTFVAREEMQSLLACMQLHMLHPYIKAVLPSFCRDPVVITAYAQTVTKYSNNDMFSFVDAPAWRQCVGATCHQALSTNLERALAVATAMIRDWEQSLQGAREHVSEKGERFCVYFPLSTHLCEYIEGNSIKSQSASGGKDGGSAVWLAPIADALAARRGKQHSTGRVYSSGGSNPKRSASGGVTLIASQWYSAEDSAATPTVHGESTVSVCAVAEQLQRLMRVATIAPDSGDASLLDCLIAWMSSVHAQLQNILTATLQYSSSQEKLSEVRALASTMEVAAMAETLHCAIGRAATAGGADAVNMRRVSTAFESLVRSCWQPFGALIAGEYAAGIREVYRKAMPLESDGAAVSTSALLQATLAQRQSLFRLENAHRFRAVSGHSGAQEEAVLAPVTITDELVIFISEMQAVLLRMLTHSTQNASVHNGSGGVQIVNEVFSTYHAALLEATVRFYEELYHRCRQDPAMALGQDNKWQQLYLDARFMQRLWAAYLGSSLRGAEMGRQLEAVMEMCAQCCDPLRWRSCRPFMDNACEHMISHVALSMGLPMPLLAERASTEGDGFVAAFAPPREVSRFMLLPIAGTSVGITGPRGMLLGAAHHITGDAQPSAASLHPMHRPSPGTAAAAAMHGSSTANGRGSRPTGSAAVSSAAATAFRGLQSLWGQ